MPMLTQNDVQDDLDAKDGQQVATCPVCNGPGTFLGPLGCMDHYRCRDCGAMFHVDNGSCS
jgi:hypothetical protein